MLKNITLSAEEHVIKKAREKASNEQKSLNTLFRDWLARYISNANVEDDYDRFMESVSYANPGRRFLRDEMNANCKSI